ncbi:MAG: Dabb family protein [Phycisphaerales bacterium]|nr:Dabb family protein [Phycisphaerales bacterium]
MMRLACNRLLPLLLLCPLLTACANTGSKSSPAAHQAAINHVVLIRLINPEDTGELLRDNERLLGAIPSVRTFWSGTPLDIGRGAPVDGDYTVGLCVGFDDVEGYNAYLVAPEHVELVEKWKPRWNGVRIFDVVTPN